MTMRWSKTPRPESAIFVSCQAPHFTDGSRPPRPHHTFVHARRGERGTSLVEVLIVIAVLALGLIVAANGLRGAISESARKQGDAILSFEIPGVGDAPGETTSPDMLPAPPTPDGTGAEAKIGAIAEVLRYLFQEGLRREGEGVIGVVADNFEGMLDALESLANPTELLEQLSDSLDQFIEHPVDTLVDSVVSMFVDDETKDLWNHGDGFFDRLEAGGRVIGNVGMMFLPGLNALKVLKALRGIGSGTDHDGTGYDSADDDDTAPPEPDDGQAEGPEPSAEDPADDSEPGEACALNALSLGAGGKGGGRCGPGEEDERSSTDSNDDGILLDDLGGKARVPKGTNLAFGLNAHLEEFARSQSPNDEELPQTVSLLDAWDEQYIRYMVADPELFSGNFGRVVDSFIQNGGRIKFNLTGLETGGAPTSFTEYELRRIVETERWEAATDFYLDGELLTGAALDEALQPWRGLDPPVIGRTSSQ